MMSSDTSKGLPPVAPPSGKFIVQLFLVPFIIVASIVCFLLAFNWLVGGARSPEEFLKKLDDSNPDIRWRGAQDLAQVLLRDETLASDPKFALDLVERFHRAIATYRLEEKTVMEGVGRLPDDGNAAKAIEANRDYVLYLSGCMGNLVLPVGASLLGELACDQQGSDARVLARRRYQALWALANLGENTKRFDRLAPVRQEAILAGLESEASASNPRREHAGSTLAYLKTKSPRSLSLLGLDGALESCLSSDDPFLREVAAYALNFWEGDEREKARFDDLLVKLTYDDGRGEDILKQLRDDKADRVAVTGSPGRRIRYNAVIALARRGSSHVRLPLLQEMLDEATLRQHFRLRKKDGQEVADDAMVTLTLVTALKAVAELHRKQSSFDLSPLYPSLDELARNSNSAIQIEARQTLIALGR